MIIPTEIEKNRLINAGFLYDEKHHIFKKKDLHCEVVKTEDGWCFHFMKDNKICTSRYSLLSAGISSINKDISSRSTDDIFVSDAVSIEIILKKQKVTQLKPAKTVKPVKSTGKQIEVEIHCLKCGKAVPCIDVQGKIKGNRAVVLGVCKIHKTRNMKVVKKAWLEKSGLPIIERIK